MKAYVAGFLFTNLNGSTPSVVLIKKNRGPAGMKGKLNAVGGHIEPVELALEAMRREFKEETGYEGDIDWKQFATLAGEDWVVHFYKAEQYVNVKSVTDEQVDWYHLDKVLQGEYPMMKNLKWLIPLAMDSDVNYASIADGVAQ